MVMMMMDVLLLLLLFLFFLGEQQHQVAVVVASPLTTLFPAGAVGTFDNENNNNNKNNNNVGLHSEFGSLLHRYPPHDDDDDDETDNDDDDETDNDETDNDDDFDTDDDDDDDDDDGVHDVANSRVNNASFGKYNNKDMELLSIINEKNETIAYEMMKKRRRTRRRRMQSTSYEPLWAPFNKDTNWQFKGFEYKDDIFRDTVNSNIYADGIWNTDLKRIRVYLGGVDNNAVYNMSGGWETTYSLIGGPAEVVIEFKYRIYFHGQLDDGDDFEVLCSNDGVLIGTGDGNDYVDQFIGYDGTTLDNWQIYNRGNRYATLDLGVLPEGEHIISLGGYLTSKDKSFEYVYVDFDNVRITATEYIPTFQTKRINCGGSAFIAQSNGNSWRADGYIVSSNGKSSSGITIANTDDPEIYQSYRYGSTIIYQIPTLTDRGDFDVYLHFAELSGTTSRLFNATINGVVYIVNLDVDAEAGGIGIPVIKYIAMQNVTQGHIRIELNAAVGAAIISGIEIIESIPHYAHSVPGESSVSYEGVIRDGTTALGMVDVDGSGSHTHLLGDNLIVYTWIDSITGNILGNGEYTTLSLPVGEHEVILHVEDSVSYDDMSTTITIQPYGYPVIDILYPDFIEIGSVSDSTLIITGVGFTYTAADTIVHLGTYDLTGNDITVVNSTTIIVSPVPLARTSTGVVLVTVETPIGETVGIDLLFVDIPIEFEFGIITTFPDAFNPVTVIKYGPDSKLYVGTYAGYLYKHTLDENYNIIDTITSTVISTRDTMGGGSSPRSILGIAFDPRDINPNPTVYVTNSILYTASGNPWSSSATNGRVSTLSGFDLTIVNDIVTGIPVSAIDHAVNGLEFDNDGKLYIQVGGNTNLGIPSAKMEYMEESYYSGSTLVAHIRRPNFDGDITYDTITGEPMSGFDVELYTIGMRNPFGIMIHSNGYMYGSDNGPNSGFGDKSVTCNATTDSVAQRDKINVIHQGMYYGHPNRLRASIDNDPKQCTWRSAYASSDGIYQAPLATPRSSTNGIVEYKTQHFGGTIRGNLILARYRKKLNMIQLSNDGLSLDDNQEIDPNGGLDVEQGPDGTLFVAQYKNRRLIYLKPVDAYMPDDIYIKSVYPWRGPITANQPITIYGVNFHLLNHTITNIRIGPHLDCIHTMFMSSTKLHCTTTTTTTPATIITPGKVDVSITDGIQSDVMIGAYTYVS